MAKKWSEIRDRMTPAQAVRVEAKVQEMLKDPKFEEVPWDNSPERLAEEAEWPAILQAEDLADKLIREHLSGMFARETLDECVRRLLGLGMKECRGAMNPRLLEDALRNLLDRG